MLIYRVKCFGGYIVYLVSCFYFGIFLEFSWNILGTFFVSLFVYLVPVSHNMTGFSFHMCCCSLLSVVMF